MAHYSPHVLYVRSLYRQALRTCFDWSKSHHHFRQSCIHTRYSFEYYRAMTNPKQLSAILAKAEQILKDKAHPEPYRYPTSPFGTKFERNAPVPLHIVNHGFGQYVDPISEYGNHEPYYEH